MAVIYANSNNFDETISSGLTLVDFYADWCGPCKMIAPILEEVAGSRDDVKIVKVDVDANQAIAQRYEVMSIPTLILFKEGNVVAQTLGFQPKASLEQWIDSNK